MALKTSAFGLIDTEFSFDDIINKNVYKEISNLKKQFKQIINKKIEECKKIDNSIDRVVIFIDDMDRIDSGKAIELLECFKNFLDVENCIFIFAIDYDVIIKGACDKFGEKKGKAFFDKIIKLPFVLPIEHYNIRSYIETIINDMFVNEEPLVVNYFKSKVELYLSLLTLTVGNNPRAIGRIFNSFFIYYKMDRYSFSENGSIDNKTDVNYAIEINDLLFYYCCRKW